MHRALVVDDSRAMRMITPKRSSNPGLKWSKPRTGRRLSTIWSGTAVPFQLVMVDWNMPELSGLEFIQAVRARPEFAAIRLPMATTETEIEQISRALEAGVDEYLMKPLTPDSVRDKLRLLGMCE